MKTYFESVQFIFLYLFAVIGAQTAIKLKKYVTLGEFCDDKHEYCHHPLVCVKDICVFIEKEFGEACTKNYQCLNPYVCEDGYCDHRKVIGKICQYDHNCRKGLFCRFGRCEDLT